jgi:hypothetical protein
MPGNFKPGYIAGSQEQFARWLEAATVDAV